MSAPAPARGGAGAEWLASPTEEGASSGGPSSFECNICFEGASQPVVTLCGHLFCWTCLYRWLRQGSNECPVCKAGVTRENVVPIYGRGAEDPRKSSPRGADAEDAKWGGGGGGDDDDDEDVPSRPAGQRPNIPRRRPRHAHAAPQAFPRMGGVTFSAGFGFFPSLLGLQFVSGDVGGEMDEVAQRQEALSRALWVIGAFILCCIIFF